MSDTDTARGVTSEDEVVDLCRELIRIDTSNYGDHSGPGERKAAEYVAEKLADDGISVEVLDLRSLVPLDREAVLTSVAKTGRLVVVDEDYLSFGLSGEILATVVETDPGLLTAPPKRVATPDAPIPYAHVLEYAVLPLHGRIESAIREVLA